MANNDKDFRPLLERDDRWHWKENEMLARVLTEGSPELGADISKRLKELQPKYKGPINLPQKFGEYLMRRGDAWNVKEMLAVMAVWSGDKANAGKAMDGIMEAFRNLNGEPAVAPASKAAQEPYVSKGQDDGQSYTGKGRSPYAGPYSPYKAGPYTSEHTKGIVDGKGVVIVPSTPSLDGLNKVVENIKKL